MCLFTQDTSSSSSDGGSPATVTSGSSSHSAALAAGSSTSQPSGAQEDFVRTMVCANFSHSFPHINFISYSALKLILLLFQALILFCY